MPGWLDAPDAPGLWWRHTRNDGVNRFVLCWWDGDGDPHAYGEDGWAFPLREDGARWHRADPPPLGAPSRDQELAAAVAAERNACAEVAQDVARRINATERSVTDDQPDAEGYRATLHSRALGAWEVRDAIRARGEKGGE